MCGSHVRRSSETLKPRASGASFSQPLSVRANFNVAAKQAADAKRPASIAALTLGVLIAIVGVRILDTIGTLSATSIWATAIWNGVDVVLSGGLLAGGSFLIHEVTETISGAIKRVDPG